MMKPFSVIDIDTFSHRLDPEAQMGDTPRALELAADAGHTETFALLAARLKMDSDWFKLAQVSGHLVLRWHNVRESGDKIPR